MKKKLMVILLSIMLIVGSLSTIQMVVSATEVNSEVVGVVDGDFEYFLLDDGTAEITGYNGTATELTIPSEINGYDVTSISRFYGCTSISNIKIPSSVSKINNYSFEACRNLIEINVDLDNMNYTSVNGVLYNKNKSELIKYPEGKSENSYSILDSVTSIAPNAFRNCTSLVSIIIPNSVTSIGDLAFYFCTSLKEIKIPDSTFRIGTSAFLCTAWYDDQLDGLVYAGKIVYQYKGDMSENTSLFIKDGTKGIADSAFYDCENLKNIVIPDSVISIGDNAFRDCTNLTSITLQNNLTSIGVCAFCNCVDLKSVNIPHSVIYIGKDAFGYTYEEDNSWFFEKIDGFTIYGYSATAAETYANENGFTFIAITEKEIGDANGDGEVNAKDRMTLTRYLAKWSGYENIDMISADLNSDDEVNAKDRMILTRHLAKWQGYENLPFDKF